jgi:hypothetical protein
VLCSLAYVSRKRRTQFLVVFKESHHDFHSCCNNLYPTHSVKGFQFPTSSPAFVVFLIIIILTGVRWNLNVLLICISFRGTFVDHFFMPSLAIYVSLFEDSFQFICTFLNWIICPLLFCFLTIIYTLILIPCQMNTCKESCPIP